MKTDLTVRIVESYLENFKSILIDYGKKILYKLYYKTDLKDLEIKGFNKSIPFLKDYVGLSVKLQLFSLNRDLNSNVCKSDRHEVDKAHMNRRQDYLAAIICIQWALYDQGIRQDIFNKGFDFTILDQDNKLYSLYYTYALFSNYGNGNPGFLFNSNGFCFTRNDVTEYNSKSLSKYGIECSLFSGSLGLNILPGGHSHIVFGRGSNEVNKNCLFVMTEKVKFDDVVYRLKYGAYYVKSISKKGKMLSDFCKNELHISGKSINISVVYTHLNNNNLMGKFRGFVNDLFNRKLTEEELLNRTSMEFFINAQVDFHADINLYNNLNLYDRIKFETPLFLRSIKLIPEFKTIFNQCFSDCQLKFMAYGRPSVDTEKQQMYVWFDKEQHKFLYRINSHEYDISAYEINKLINYSSLSFVSKIFKLKQEEGISGLQGKSFHCSDVSRKPITFEDKLVYAIFKVVSDRGHTCLGKFKVGDYNSECHVKAMKYMLFNLIETHVRVLEKTLYWYNDFKRMEKKDSYLFIRSFDFKGMYRGSQCDVVNRAIQGWWTQSGSIQERLLRVYEIMQESKDILSDTKSRMYEALELRKVEFKEAFLRMIRFEEFVIDYVYQQNKSDQRIRPLVRLWFEEFNELEVKPEHKNSLTV